MAGLPCWASFMRTRWRTVAPELGFDVVADEGEVGGFEFCGPRGVAGDEDGDAVDHADAGFKSGFGVELGGVLAADRGGS